MVASRIAMTWSAAQRHHPQHGKIPGKFTSLEGPAVLRDDMLRCAMLRIAPEQRPRLVAIIRNLANRIEEAKINGWHGEIQGLQVSLTKAQEN